MALSAGTYINAFAVTIADPQPVTQIDLPRPDISRRELECSHRVRLFLHDGAAWTAATVRDHPTPGTHDLASSISLGFSIGIGVAGRWPSAWP